MNIEQIKYIYFLGIGGIGMSALARYFKHLGKSVSGYDKTETALTQQLQKEGIPIHFEDSGKAVQQWLGSTEETLVVLTPAIPNNHKEWAHITQSGYTIYKRAKVLGLITANKQTLAVAGTHGKTTTSTMLAHIMYQSSIKTAAFLGGISANYQTNLLLPNNDSQVVVVEADEFDRSFLHLNPVMSIITSTDADHLDIYGEHEALKQSFYDFANQTQRILLIKAELELAKQIIDAPKPYKVYTYSTTQHADYSAQNIQIDAGNYSFDLHTPDGVISTLKLGMPGRHNLENAVAASALALLNGVNNDELRVALQNFTGVKRRFEYILRTEKVIYIDDYAHHPEELRATIQSVKEMYPGKKLTVVFQPHLYSRTRDFAEGFSEALSLADQVLLMDIYPARELPIPGVSSAMLLDGITALDKSIVAKSELIDIVTENHHSIILTLGAGDIDVFVQPIAQSLSKKYGI
jgi:UDP-N-acetylmuramate--alanine ligase